MGRGAQVGGDRQRLIVRVMGGRYPCSAAGQMAQQEDTYTVQLSSNLFSGHWGDDGEWMLGIVGGY
ncbi:autotransporter outer membrane beta-barrel domain-containing protein, partial [Escherichia coli]|uniref:autotransporter outer membrane beta-barrel domain-containing protein n=1 Tax=Escherichia coli TaxID=562 RepID=UPI0035D4758F